MFNGLRNACVLLVCLATPLAGAARGSLYSVPIRWTNDRGQSVTLEAFQNKWTVISMMYTSCPSSCPMIVQKMRKVEARLQAQGKSAEFVLVTFDPQRDTPDRLKKHREKIAVNEGNWHFLGGASADTRRFSMLLGIKYTRDGESGEFLHDNKIVLISPDGQIVARLESLGDSEEEFVNAVQKGKVEKK